MISQEDLINEYEILYFKPVDLKRKKQLLGNKVRLPGTDCEVEDFLFPGDKICECDEIRKLHIEWKAGRLTFDMIYNEIKTTDLNGMGKTIEHLDEFLINVNGKKNEILYAIKDGQKESAKKAISILIGCKKDADVKQLGTVYILTVLFFLSGGKYPIYDKYAHTAAKALFFNKTPKDIFVGDAPQCSIENIDKIAGMYEEYCWLLEHLYGTFSIPRALDRALWVYGHKMKE